MDGIFTDFTLAPDGGSNPGNVVLNANVNNNNNNNNNAAVSMASIQTLTEALNQMTLSVFSLQGRVNALEKQVQYLTVANNKSNNNNNNNDNNNNNFVAFDAESALRYQQYMAAMQYQQQMMAMNAQNYSPDMSPTAYPADFNFPVINNNNNNMQQSKSPTNPYMNASNTSNNNNNNNNTPPINMDPSRGNNEQLERACQQQPDCREVSLKGCKHVTNLSPLYTLRQLWRLNLQGCVNVVDNETLSLISQHNRRLSRLNLCGCEKITDARPLAQLPYLFDLNLSGCNIGNDSLDEIAMHCQQLSRLAINSCPRLTNIAVLLHLKMLKLLYCRYSENISIDSVGSVLVTNGSVLLTLNIDGLRFDQLSIANLPHHSSLNYLNMKDNVVLVSLEWLTKVADRLGELEMLDVEGCEALADIRGVELFPKLKVLRLSRTAVSVEAVLQTVPKCKELTTLSLDGCPHLFTDGDSAVNLAELITPLKHLKKLILPQSLQGTPAVAEIKDRVEVIYVNPPNNNNNNNSTTNNNNNNLTVPNHFHSPGGSAHHSSFTTPTTHKVPQLPSM